MSDLTRLAAAEAEIKILRNSELTLASRLVNKDLEIQRLKYRNDYGVYATALEKAISELGGMAPEINPFQANMIGRRMERFVPEVSDEFWAKEQERKST